MSLARRHRERMAAQIAASRAVGSDVVSSVAAVGPAGRVSPPPAGGNAEKLDPVAAQIRMRFTHDLRRLKEIQSIERKIAAKREMLPEYAAWVEGLMASAKAIGQATQEDILPTVMVWKIDTGDFVGALELAEHVLRYRVALPKRYERTAATLIVEEIADAALKALGQGEAFDLEILEHTALLAEDEDMPDEVRAKLVKATGLELVRQADAGEASGEAPPVAPARTLARDYLARARDLHPKCGVAKAIEKLDRQLKVTAQNSGEPETT